MLVQQITTRPLTDSDATPLAAPTEHLVARIVITSALALGTFVLCYYVIADHVLHEPVVAGGLHGNALGFIDWFALITLLYVVGFDSYGAQRALGEAGSEVDDATTRSRHARTTSHSKYREISS